MLWQGALTKSLPFCTVDSVTMSKALKCHKQLFPWFAVVSALTFLCATNYCAVEALAEGPIHHEGPSGHSHNEGVPTPKDQSDPCCSTLQAVVTPPFNLLIVAGPQPLFQEVPLQSPNGVRVADLSLAPSGLSPPARAPTPARPFYRTTFASHAPPVLA